MVILCISFYSPFDEMSSAYQSPFVRSELLSFRVAR